MGDTLTASPESSDDTASELVKSMGKTSMVLVDLLEVTVVHGAY